MFWQRAADVELGGQGRLLSSDWVKNGDKARRRSRRHSREDIIGPAPPAHEVIA